MKDRVREAVFNLIGPRVREKHVLDLFAGTGAMAIESLSRGAVTGTLIERKFPNVRQIKDTAIELGVLDQLKLVAGDTFFWARRLSDTKELPWLIFCCPPYELYQSRRADLVKMLEELWTAAPVDSVLVIETDERCDPRQLLQEAEWDVREYPPAVIGIAHKLRAA
jgi:16S rRNA (guanine966-N2)-methyltransferase